MAEHAVSPREREVLGALVERMTNAEIAQRLHISIRTVESHVASLLRKTGASDRRDLALRGADVFAQAAAAPSGVDALPPTFMSLVANTGGRDPASNRHTGLRRLDVGGDRMATISPLPLRKGGDRAGRSEVRDEVTGDRAEQLRSLLQIGSERRQAGRLAEARAAFLGAADLAEAGGDRAALVDAALGAPGLWVQEERDVLARAVLRALWDKAATVVAPDSVDGARLAVRRAAEAVYEGGSVEAVIAALGDLRRLGDDGASAEGLSLLHHVQLGPRYAETRLRLAGEIIAAATRAGDGLLSLMGLTWRTVDLFLLGDPRAGQSLRELRERSTTASCEALEFIADALEAMTIARSGRFEEAEAAAARAAQRGSAVGDPDAPAYFGAMLAALRWWEGRVEEIIDLVRDISTSPRLGPNDHVYVAADALLSASLGDSDQAEETLARLNGIGLRTLPQSSSWMTTQFLVAETAYLVGDAETAATVRHLLSPYGHLPVMPSLAVVCLGSAERSLGLCAATMGDPDAAIRHLELAVAADRRLGSRPMAVLTEHTLSGVLGARGGAGDRDRSEQLARHVRDRAQRLGMVLPGHPPWLATGLRRVAGPPRKATLQRLPRGWRLVVDGKATVLPDRVGFRYLVQLVSRPGTDCEVLELARSGPSASGTADERARTAVRKALMRAIDALESEEPELGAHLRSNVATGVTCTYSSAPGWDLTVLSEWQPGQSPSGGPAQPTADQGRPGRLRPPLS